MTRETDGTAAATGGPQAHETTLGPLSTTSSGFDDGTTSRTAGSSDNDSTPGVKLDIDFDPADTEGGPDPTKLSCSSLDQFPPSSQGCEFWGATWVPLSDGLGYGIGVGNPSAQSAHIVIEDERGRNGTLRQVTAIDLAPGESQLIEVTGTGSVLGNVSVAASVGTNPNTAFRITSDQPITAMQIAPVGGSQSFVPEASLLLPINALSTSYLTVGYTAVSGGGRIAVIATQDDTTVSTSQGELNLDAFDVRLYSSTDSTGFFVGATAPVAVFSGTTLSYVPADLGAGDHLEEQVVPLSSWGTAYVGGRHPPRVPNLNPEPELVYWRVIAGQQATAIALTPPIPGVGTTIELAEFGDFYEFASADSFVATSDQPFMLAQYMSGCRHVVPNPVDPTSPCDEGPTGDPFVAQMPPIAQWLTETTFVTDTSYARDFVTIVREAGTHVELECLGTVPEDHFAPIAGTSYEVGTVELDGLTGEGDCHDGQQYLRADAPVGLLVGGLDWASSYAYPGGMSYGALWSPPTRPPG